MDSSRRDADDRHAQAAPSKRPRYAGSSAAHGHSGKEDPSRAAALPATLPLDGGRKASATTFGATTFGMLPLDTYLQRQLVERMQLARLTPVQQHAIPALLAGGDLLVRSPTGSGKTLAYAVPVIQSLVARGPAVVTRSAGTFALVLVPTRELCLQTHEVVCKATAPYPWLVTSTLMGGERKKAEKARLRKGVALLVGTPGRIADHVESTSAWDVSRCAHLVLDEADRLLDLGFQHSIDQILLALESRRAADAPRRQSVLLSATLTKGLRELAGRSLLQYSTLTLSAAGASFSHGEGEPAPPVASAATPDAAQPDARAGELGDDSTEGASPAGTPGALAPATAAAGSSARLDAPSGLVQSYVLVPTKQKLTALLALVRSRSLGRGACKMIVFVSSCDGVDFLFELLAEAGGWPDASPTPLSVAIFFAGWRPWASRSPGPISG